MRVGTYACVCLCVWHDSVCACVRERDRDGVLGKDSQAGSHLTLRTEYSWLGISLVAQTVKNSPAKRETWVQPSGWEDPLEKGTATHSSILAWRIPWTEEPGRLQSMGLQRVRHD